MPSGKLDKPEQEFVHAHGPDAAVENIYVFFFREKVSGILRNFRLRSNISEVFFD